MIQKTSILALMAALMAISPPVWAHRLGRLSRPQLEAYRACESSPLLPKTQAYLRAILRRLAEGSPELINGELDPDRACLRFERSEKVGGSASPVDAMLVLKLGTFKQADSAEMIAAILAHEVSHLLLRHESPFGGGGNVLPFEYSDSAEYMGLKAYAEMRDWQLQTLQQLKRDLGAERQKLRNPEEGASPVLSEEQVEKRLAQIEVELQRLNEWIGTIRPGYDKAMERKYRLERELLPLEMKHGWEEQEADEVGLELLLRAGISPSGFRPGFLAMLPESDRNACIDTLIGVTAGSCAPPPRIQGELATHPLPCWRLFNLEMNEAGRTHREEYTEMMRSVRPLEISPSLEEVREEIRALDL